MDSVEKCLDCMDFACDFTQWRDNLPGSLTAGQKAYWLDEEVQNLASNLDAFLAERVCPDTGEEELLREMWSVADIDQRRCLVGVLLKVMK